MAGWYSDARAPGEVRYERPMPVRDPVSPALNDRSSKELLPDGVSCVLRPQSANLG